MRGKRKQPKTTQPQAAEEFHYQPFRELKKVVVKAQPKSVVPAPQRVPVTPPPPTVDDESLFLRAVADARPLSETERGRIAAPAPASSPRAVTDPEAEALAELSDLVAGNAPFDLTDSDEYVEGAVVGIDPRLVRRLRQGEFAYQAHLDLHRMTRDQARAAVDTFLLRAWQEGKRCVLIIHGRGRNSKDQVPVLKGLLTSWLARSQWSRHVLAFTSARACDGGVGALYVLLRRRRESRQAFRVTNGAKV